MERCLNQKQGFKNYFRTPCLMERNFIFYGALAKFLKHLVNFFQDKIKFNRFISKLDLYMLCFRSQVKFIPTNVPTSMHYQLLKILCIALHYQDLESVENVLRPLKNYDTCIRTLIRAKNLSHFLDRKEGTEINVHLEWIGGMAPFLAKIMAKCKNPNAPNKFGSTAMHLVAKLGLFKIAEVLLPYCNNLDARDHDGKTALDIAIQWKHHKTVKILNSAL